MTTEAGDLPTSAQRRELLRRFGQAAAALSVPTWLAACGGGGGGGASAGGNGEPGSLSAEERMLAMDSMKAEYDRLCNGRLSAPSEAVAAAMRQLPQFRRVEVMPDGCVWGQFVDGQHYVVGNNLKTGSNRVAGSSAPASLIAPPAAPRPSAKNDANARAAALAPGSGELSGVPSAAVALSLSSFSNYADAEGTSFAIDNFEHLLKRAGHEVRDTDYGFAVTIELLKNMPELGFLNWFTHGGMLNGSGGITHALMTAEQVDEAGILAHLLDLDAGNLIYYLGQHVYRRGQWAADNFFAITPEFITRYRWRFSANSIVMIHACASDNAGFREAFRQAGASLYGGWSKPVWVHRAADAMTWLLDGFLAANLDIPTPEPRDRAFDYLSLKADFDEKQVTRYDDPTEGGEVSFNFTRFKDDPAGLMPSMVRATVMEHREQVILRGSFGNVRGRVFVGTDMATDPSGNAKYMPWWPAGTVTELVIDEWNADEVVARLPPDGAGSAGHIAVRVGDRWSNCRTLTRWRGTIHVIGRGPGSLVIEHRVHFAFRSDVGHWREMPKGPLQDGPAGLALIPDVVTSFWEWWASGSNTATVPGDVTLQVTWNGSGVVETSLEPRANQVYTLLGSIDRRNRQVGLMFAGGSLGALPMRQVHTTPYGSTTTDGLADMSLPAALAPADGAHLGIPLVLGDDLTIEGGEFTVAESSKLPTGESEPPPITYTVSWERIVPEYLPSGKAGV